MEQGFIYTQEEVKGMYQIWHSTFPFIKIKMQREMLKSKHYITSVFGRICRLETPRILIFRFKPHAVEDSFGDISNRSKRSLRKFLSV